MVWYLKNIAQSSYGLVLKVICLLIEMKTTIVASTILEQLSAEDSHAVRLCSG